MSDSVREGEKKKRGDFGKDEKTSVDTTLLLRFSSRNGVDLLLLCTDRTKQIHSISKTLRLDLVSSIHCGRMEARGSLLSLFGLQPPFSYLSLSLSFFNKVPFPSKDLNVVNLIDLIFRELYFREL